MLEAGNEKLPQLLMPAVKLAEHELQHALDFLLRAAPSRGPRSASPGSDRQARNGRNNTRVLFGLRMISVRFNSTIEQLPAVQEQSSMAGT